MDIVPKRGFISICPGMLHLLLLFHQQVIKHLGIDLRQFPFILRLNFLFRIVIHTQPCLYSASAARFSSSHTFTIASVSSLQYASRLFRAFSCSSGGMNRIAG